MGKQWKQWQTILWGSKITADGDCSLEIKKMLAPWKKSYDPHSILKSRDTIANKGPSHQSYGFSSSRVWMWELDYKESWAPKNWCFWNVVLEKTFENPLDCKEIQPVHPKISSLNIHWMLNIHSASLMLKLKLQHFGLWPPDVKNWLIWKDPDAVKDWKQGKGTTEDEMVTWHPWLNWTCVWVNSGNWWWTGRPGVLQSMESKRVGHDWATELNSTERNS